MRAVVLTCTCLGTARVCLFFCQVRNKQWKGVRTDDLVVERVNLFLMTAYRSRKPVHLLFPP